MNDLTPGCQEEQIELEQQADPRIKAIATEARERQWHVRWDDTPHGVQLLVHPIISDPEQYFSFGVGVRLGGALECWVWEHNDNTMIEPWVEGDAEGPEFGSELYPMVETLEDCLAVFDKGASRYLASMRRYCLEHLLNGKDELAEWADIEPLAGRKARG